MPGDADDAVAGGDALGVGAAVVFEGLAALVPLVAVDLDDQLVLWPAQVDELAFDVDVDQRTREAGGDDERDEVALGERAGPDEVWLGEDGFDGLGAGVVGGH